MTERKEYEMTPEDLNTLMEAMKPVPYIIIGGISPRSRQECANAAWAALGDKMGFQSMSVRPNGKGDRFFTAIPTQS